MRCDMCVCVSARRVLSMKYTKEHFTADCTMEWAIESDMPNTDINKVYHGHTGMVEFTRRLLELDLVDFKPVITPASPDTALVKATFKPKNKASGKASGEYVEYHQWTAKDGKISNVKVVPTTPSAMNSIFMSAAEAEAIVMGIHETWGAGLFGDGTTPEQKALYEKYMTDDCVVDASSGEGVLKNTNGWKLYSPGPEGFFGWLKFLNTLEFHDFTIHGMSMINDSMIATVSYSMTSKATGKTSPKITDVNKWFFTGGKISKIVFYSGNFKAFDDVFAA